HPDLATLHSGNLIGQIGMLFAVAGEHFFPGFAQLMTALANAGGKMSRYAIRHIEFRVFRPAIIALSQADFFLAQRLTVSFFGVLFIGSSVSNVAIDDDEGRTVSGGDREFNRTDEQIKVVGVAHASDIPTVAHEARRYILSKCQSGIAFDGDVIVVVDPAKIVELEVAGER